MLIVHVHVATCVRFSIINHSHNIIIAMYCGYSVAQELHLLQKLPQRFIGLFKCQLSQCQLSVASVPSTESVTDPSCGLMEHPGP